MGRTTGDEAERLAALARYGILDTPPEPAFDRITAMAARMLDVPIALLVLVDERRQWFKSHHGLAVAETPREVSFCTFSIQASDVFVVEDATADPRFAKNPLVLGDPYIRFYAGAPLVTFDGLNVGTLAVLDRRPRQLSGADRELLRALARVAMKEIELRLVAGAAGLELEDQDPRLQILLEQVPAALWTCDRALQLTSASGALLAELRVEANEFLGGPLAAATPGEEGESVMAAHRRALAGESVNYDVHWGGFWFHAHVRPLRDAAGSVVGTIGIALDMTEHHRLQLRLAQAERLAAIGTLSAGVAHEINNPLTYVNINLGLARQTVQAVARRAGSADPEVGMQLARVDDLLRDSLTGAARVQKIVGDLKTFARADLTAADAPADPIPVLEASISMASNQIRHVARLERDLRPVPQVALGEGRLAQVCLNLLVNAAQAIPEGHASDHVIRVSTRREGPMVIIEVCDTGAGIAPDDLSRIFEPFFTTKEAGEGTGLGLSIVRGIVEQAGGTVQVTTEAGLTRFVVALPISQAAAPATPSAARGPVGRRRILVVEDDPMVARAIARILEGAHQVEMVPSGRAALDLLAGDRAFHVILVDMLMADVAGPELYAELERTAPDLAGRVIFMTGGAFTPAARRFLEEVDRPILTKPFGPGELEELLARAGPDEE